MHFDWAWRTLFNRDWENQLFSYQAITEGMASGSDWFRQPQFTFWIGYDFRNYRSWIIDQRSI